MKERVSIDSVVPGKQVFLDHFLVGQQFNRLHPAIRKAVEITGHAFYGGGDTEYRLMHESPPRRARMGGEREPSLRTPKYAVVMSQTIDEHPNRSRAYELAGVLSGIPIDPWGGMELIRDRLLTPLNPERNGFGVPPILVIIAQDGDFPSFDNGMTHGRHVTIVSEATHLGTIRMQDDLAFIIVWGSRVWERRLRLNLSPQALQTIQHELAHELVIITLENNPNIDPKYFISYDVSARSALGVSLWEAFADIIAGGIEYAKSEELSRYYVPTMLSPKHTYLAQLSDRENRTLGNATVLLNQLLWEMMLRRMNGESPNDMRYDQRLATEASIAFLERCRGRIFEGTDKHPSGWLTNSMTRQLRFPFRQELRQVRHLSAEQLQHYLKPLLYPQISRVGQQLLADYNRFGAYWMPFGQDTLK